VLDFDGLILDTEITGFQAWQEVFEVFGHEYAIEDYRKIVGSNSRAADPRKILEGLIGRTLDWAVINPTRKARELSLAGQLPLKPGVVTLLDQAATLGIPVAVASSSSHHWVDGHLARLGLLDRFMTTVCAEDVPQVKPAPDLYLEAIRRLEIPAGNVLAFEDSHNGSLAAKRAGVRCIVIPNEITRGQDFSHADQVIPSLVGFSLSE